MKKSTTALKIKLNAETIKALNTKELTQAGGGGPPVSAHIKCVG